MRKQICQSFYKLADAKANFSFLFSSPTSAYGEVYPTGPKFNCMSKLPWIRRNHNLSNKTPFVLFIFFCTLGIVQAIGLLHSLLNLCSVNRGVGGLETNFYLILWKLRETLDKRHWRACDFQDYAFILKRLIYWLSIISS